MELGGPVLTAIAVTILLMWVLIFERILFFRGERWKLILASIKVWENRPERRSWNAHRIRESLISQLSESVNSNISVIKTLVALCPLLGLLGTVTGMIEVFDVLAITGAANARAMAEGVARATVPTMAGMVGALSGVFAATILARLANDSVERLDGHLTLDH
ncbi:MAG: MotA/TolQ/ExbB proton channel family protein [Gemmatimonadetes bacterium]|nr:MotA/TolQ/ExbB proton channel family protein [Gemmatimonadota bacterium]